MFYAPSHWANLMPLIYDDTTGWWSGDHTYCKKYCVNYYTVETRLRYLLIGIVQLTTSPWGLSTGAVVIPSLDHHISSPFPISFSNAHWIMTHEQTQFLPCLPGRIANTMLYLGLWVDWHIKAHMYKYRLFSACKTQTSYIVLTALGRRLWN